MLYSNIVVARGWSILKIEQTNNPTGFRDAIGSYLYVSNIYTLYIYIEIIDIVCTLLSSLYDEFALCFP